MHGRSRPSHDRHLRWRDGSHDGGATGRADRPDNRGRSEGADLTPAPLPRLGHNLSARLWFVEYYDPQLGLCRLWFTSQREAQRILRKARAMVQA